MNSSILLAFLASLLIVNLPAASADGDGDKDGDAVEAKDSKEDRQSKRQSRRLAKKKFEEGMGLVREQRYSEAIVVLDEAYQLGGEPEHLYNLGTISRLNGDIKGAYEYYQKFLATNPKGNLAANAQKNMVELEEKLEEERAREKETRALEEATRKAKQELEQVRAEIETAQQALRDSQAESQASQKEAAAMRAERDRVAELLKSGRGKGKRMIGSSMLAVGGLALGAGILAGLDARSANNELDGLGMEDTWNVSRDWLHERGSQSETRMIVFTATGVALLAGGAVLYYLGDRDARKPISKESMAVSPTLTPNSAGMAVSGRF